MRELLGYDEDLIFHFASATAELGENGRTKLQQVAAVQMELMPSSPDDLQWILRMDGHTDQVSISSAKFALNWELSMARAVSVVRYLAEKSIPEKRMAAAVFSPFHPLDPADSEEAYRKNRRFEIRHTSR